MGVDPESRLSAERLLAHRLGKSRSWLFAHNDHELEPADIEIFEQGLKRIDAGEPLAYLLGSWEFYSLNLTVTSDSLVPRPERHPHPRSGHHQLPRHPRILDPGVA